MSAGSLTHSFSKNNSICFSPSPSMSKARRETKWRKMLDLLERTGELAGAARARALLAGGGLLAHDSVCSGARAFLREMIGLGVFRPLVDDHVEHLRDDVAGALDDDGVADADVAALAQLLAVAADALDVVLVVQRRVLHDDAADGDRLELGDRRQRAGAADLDLDVLEDGGGLLGRELVRDRPARRARDEAEPLLPVEAVDLVDDAVDVVVELGAAALRCRGGRRAVPRSSGRAWSADWS